LDVGPPTKLAPSSSLSGRVGTGGRVWVAALAPPVCSSGSWTRRLQEFMYQMGIPTGFRVKLQYWQQLESNSTYTVGAPTDCEWKCETESTDTTFWIFRIPRNLKNTYRLGCELFWSTVVSIIDYEKIIFEIACQPSTVFRVEEVRGRGAPTSPQGV
jgi:hypothetical protein